MIVSIVAAMDRNRLIGNERGMPWHLPADLRRFRRLTLGKPIILGRTTFEHIGRPLDGRLNIVLSRRPDFQPEGVAVARSPEEALRLAGNVPEVMIVGGAEVYRLFLPRANRMYLTWIDGEFEGTTHFPDIPPAPIGQAWVPVESEFRPADEKNPRAMTYEQWELRPAPVV